MLKKNVFLLVCLMLVPLFAEDVISSLIKKVQTEPVEMSFDLEIFWAIREKTEKKSGDLLLSGEDYFDLSLGTSRWVSDGVSVWQYSEKNNQLVIKSFLDMDMSLHPSSMFERFGKKQFEEVSLEKKHIYRWSDAEDLEYSRIDVMLSKDKKTFEWILFVDPEGNETRYTFSKMEFLSSVEDDRFTFVAPEGVEVFDER